MSYISGLNSVSKAQPLFFPVHCLVSVIQVTKVNIVIGSIMLMMTSRENFHLDVLARDMSLSLSPSSCKTIITPVITDAVF